MKILGNKKILARLFSLAEAEKMPHAAIFLGPAKVGKFRAAREVAKKMYPAAAEKIEQNLCSDVISVSDLWQMGKKENFEEIAKTSNFSQKHRVDEKKRSDTIGVDDVKSFLEPLFRTTDAPVKIVILRDAERLTTAAANALLKTLEEPPAKTFFFLTATNEKKLPATILSRCQKFFFSLVSRGELCDFLREKEVDPALFDDLLAIAQGRPEILFRLLADADFFEKMRAEFQEIARFFAGKSVAEKLKKAEILANPAENPADFLENATRFARSLLVEKAAGKNLEIGEKLSFSELLTILDAISQTQKMLEKNANRRLALENLFLKFPET